VPRAGPRCGLVWGVRNAASAEHPDNASTERIPESRAPHTGRRWVLRRPTWTISAGVRVGHADAWTDRRAGTSQQPAGAADRGTCCPEV